MRWLKILWLYMFVWKECDCCGRRGDDVVYRKVDVERDEKLCDECAHSLYPEVKA